MPETDFEYTLRYIQDIIDSMYTCEPTPIRHIKGNPMGHVNPLGLLTNGEETA